MDSPSEPAEGTNPANTQLKVFRLLCAPLSRGPHTFYIFSCYTFHLFSSLCSIFWPVFGKLSVKD